ncbi:MAG: TolC family protein [Treponema sp.]|nr:TolC family protein [Treponema sp.]
MMIRLVRFFLPAAIILFAALSAYAQVPTEREPLRLTPADAVDMAIRNNLNLEAARLGLDIQRRASSLAWNQFVPSIGVAGTLARANWPSPAMPPIMPAGHQWHLLLGQFSANLNFSFAQIENMRTLRQQYAEGLIGFDNAGLRMEQAVRIMYNNILLLQANAELLEESYRNTQRQAEMAEASFNAGLAPRLTWLQAQVAVENMRPARNDLENALENLMGNFALVLGLPHDTIFELAPVSLGVSPIPYDAADLISRAASENPDIHALQAGIMTLQSQRRALRLQHYTPFLSLGWTLSSMFEGDPMSDSWLNGNNWTSQGPQQGGAFSITLGMNFNGLLPFTREAQQIRDINTAVQIQHIMLAQTIRDTELEIFTMINSLERIRANMEVQQATVYLAEESFRLTEEAFRAGLQDFQAVQNASLALDQARLRVLTEQFNYLNDLINLEYSLGIPFGTLSSVGVPGYDGSL